MPIATIQILAGRDAERKRRMIHAVSQAIATSLEAPIDTVRVLVHEVPPELWYSGGETIAERRAAQAAATGAKS
jgi:4-oxalocrotonate tautomerase